ncbi:MAG: DUF2523 domain-containing protein [Candidatus Jettenia sp.]|nr:MAG: DUF2523 domain-containing protein [Candidatus Jettenia sp.]
MAFYNIGWGIFKLLGRWAFKSSVMFTCLKGFLTTVLLVYLPIVISNQAGKFISKLSTESLDYLGNNAYSGITSVVYDITGLAAYFANHLRVVEAFAIIVSAVATRFVMRLIPFLG